MPLDDLDRAIVRIEEAKTALEDRASIFTEGPSAGHEAARNALVSQAYAAILEASHLVRSAHARELDNRAALRTRGRLPRTADGTG